MSLGAKSMKLKLMSMMLGMQQIRIKGNILMDYHPGRDDL